jgi:phenylacetate-CoA ligase
MLESQWWTAERLRRYQDERLQAFLAYCLRHVPYYRRLFERAGVSLEQIQSLDDLDKLPFLTKKDIRENIEALKSDEAKDLARFNTGGSSGEPLIFYIGKQRVSHDVAAKRRATQWWGVDIGDPEIVVWGAPNELSTQDRIKELRDALMRTKLLPAFEMSADNLQRFVETIRRYRPRMLFGYPSSLALIARYGRDHGLSLNELGIEVAFVTAERLYEDQRQDIQTVFGCPVANGYGGRDAGFIAHQCPAGSLHITAEDIIVEIVDEAGQPLPPGASGEVVITHLATRDFPFIRYRTGDVAVLSETPCTCGRGLPVLQEIHGRTTDFIVAQDGTIMHGLALIYVLRELTGIATFKIVQESLERTRVIIVPEAAWDKANEAAIRNEYAKRLGKAVQIDIEYVDEIPRERSGKHRYVVSHVKT